jgi:hypothetical protein
VVYIIVLTCSFLISMSNISFKVSSSLYKRGEEAQLPAFLSGRHPEHMLRVQMEPPLPTLQERRWERMKRITLFMMATAIMAMALPAMLGVDITNPNGGGNSPVPTEVHKD